MRFDWKPESKERYFRKAEAAVKAAGFDDILRVDKDQFSIVKGTVKVHFKPISRDGKTRRWWEAKRTIENMHEVPPAKDQFGRKHKSIFHSRLHDFRNGGAGQMKMREVAERFRHMLKVKDCRHLCLTCEYYEICKREVNADEYEIRNEK